MKHIFDKFLPALGIGGATVDTRLNENEVAAGSKLTGEVCIHGGKTEQEIKDIVLILKAEYVQRMNADTALKQVEDLVTMRVAQNLTILPRQKVCLPFEMEIPLMTPVSLLEQNVWIHTDLDVLWAVSSEDRDYVEITPHPLMKKLLDVLIEQLGFVLKKIETKDFQYVSKTPDYTQIFVFLPQGSWRKYCEKLKVWFAFKEDGIQATFAKYDKQEELERYVMNFSEELLERSTEDLAEMIQKGVFSWFYL